MLHKIFTSFLDSFFKRNLNFGDGVHFRFFDFGKLMMSNVIYEYFIKMYNFWHALVWIIKLKLALGILTIIICIWGRILKRRKWVFLHDEGVSDGQQLAGTDLGAKEAMGSCRSNKLGIVLCWNEETNCLNWDVIECFC